MHLRGKIRMPTTRKGKVAACIGGLVAVVSVFGTISDATANPQDRQYKVCMDAYHDAKHCYDDVYHKTGGQSPSVGTGGQVPTDIPIPPSDPNPRVPAPTSWNPNPASHFFFYPDADLDTSEVTDLR